MTPMTNKKKLIFLIVIFLIFLVSCNEKTIDKLEPEKNSESEIYSEKTINSELKFYVEEGFRLNLAAQSFVIIKDENNNYQTYNPDNNGVYLTYKDTTIKLEDDLTILNPSKVAYSSDGLNFGESIEFNNYEKPGILLPEVDENGNNIYRKFVLTTDGLKSYTSTNGGNSYTNEEGYRYELRNEDQNSIGYYDIFNNQQGQIVLIYIGAFGYEEANARLAISLSLSLEAIIPTYESS